MTRDYEVGIFTLGKKSPRMLARISIMATQENWIVLLSNLLMLIAVTYSFPRARVANISREDIKHKEMLPPDHIAGGHMEHDGDLNKDFHHEAFLGTLVKEGKLQFDNMDGYRKLIGIFHQVDKNKDHLIDKNELQSWIHDRILEHYYKAKADSDDVFQKVDTDKDDMIEWYEYKATLIDLDPSKLKDANVSCKCFHIWFCIYSFFYFHFLVLSCKHSFILLTVLLRQ